MLVQHFTNVIQMFCAYWAIVVIMQAPTETNLSYNNAAAINVIKQLTRTRQALFSADYIFQFMFFFSFVNILFYKVIF